MVGQVTGARLHKGQKSAPSASVPLDEMPGMPTTAVQWGQDVSKFPINFEPFWWVEAKKGPVEIGLPKTEEDVFYNTMTYNLLRRKQREGTFEGELRAISSLDGNYRLHANVKDGQKYEIRKQGSDLSIKVRS